LKRVKVSFADMLVEFVDRERALEQVRELGEKGTYPVYVVYGPEGCGKTAFLRQAKAILEDEFGYHVVYTNPLTKKVEEILQFTSSVKDIVKDVFNLFPEPYSRIVDVAINVAGRIIEKFSKPRVAVLMDDIFQAVGLDKAEIYVKALLNLIEWPPAEYERIVVLVASSEGVTRERVGRHSWADIFVMWNMREADLRSCTSCSLIPSPRSKKSGGWLGATRGTSRGFSRLGGVRRRLWRTSLRPGESLSSSAASQKLSWRYWGRHSKTPTSC